MAQIKSEDGKEFLEAFKPGTRKVYAAGLRTFLTFINEEDLGENLGDFLDALEEDARKSRREKKRVGRNALAGYVKWLLKKKYSPKSIRTYVSTVQSLAGYYGFYVSSRYVNLPSSQPVSKKHPWTLEEVGEFVLEMEDVELRSVSAALFQSGLSLVDVLGLTWGDIKLEYLKGATPLCFDFSRKKTDVPHMTFIGQWGVSLLKEHLGSAKKRNPDPIYAVSARTIELRFKALATKKLGKFEGYNPMRPHSLRSAFRTLLGDAKLNETYIEFFMGHKIPEHKRVYLSKSREGWRKTYREYEHALTP